MWFWIASLHDEKAQNRQTPRKWWGQGRPWWAFHCSPQECERIRLLNTGDWSKKKLRREMEREQESPVHTNHRD